MVLNIFSATLSVRPSVIDVLLIVDFGRYPKQFKHMPYLLLISFLSLMVCIEEAKAELRAKARPKLKAMLDDISEYDNVFVVGPNWWGIYPIALYTQLEALNFTGKTVHYVVTHEDSGFGGVPKTMSASCKGAKLGKSLAVHGGSVPSSKTQVENWAKKAVG